MKHFLSCCKTSYSKLLKIVVLWVYLDLNQGLTRYQRVTLPPELYTHHQKTIDSFTYANIQEIAVCLLSILKMQMTVVAVGRFERRLWVMSPVSYHCSTTASAPCWTRTNAIQV